MNSFMGSETLRTICLDGASLEIGGDQSSCNPLRRCWLSQLVQLSQKTVSVGYVHGLQLLELREQRPGLRRVVAVPLQLRDDLALTSDVLRTKHYVFLSERQVLHQPPLRHVSVAWPSQP